MSQMVTECHLKWRLIHFTFIAYMITLQFSKIIGKKLPTSSCPKEGVLETTKINCELKKQIIAVHNEFRQKIARGLVPNQPPAKNMQEMFWDEELARSAQHWSEHCKFEHSEPNQRSNARFPEVGENLGQTKSKIKSDIKDFKKHMQKWFNEHEIFNYGPVTMKYLSKSGHYSQIASANSYLVGCGFSRFRIKNIYYRLYVCHYGPGGNRFNSPPYEAGDMKCTGDLKPSKTYPNLCTRKHRPPQLKCGKKSGKLGERMFDTISSTTLASTTPIMVSESPVDGRKSLDATANNVDVISSECEHTKSIADILRDGKIANNIQIDKMYNLIFINGWNMHDRNFTGGYHDD